MRSLLLFLPLAVVTNSLLPVPFEPVLLGYASQSSPWLLVSLGAAGAAIGEALSLLVLSRVARRVENTRVPGWLRSGGKRFYLWSTLVAASPLPIHLVRAAALVRRSRPLPFGVCVGLGRVPRYAAVLALWRGAVAPGGLLALLT